MHFLKIFNTKAEMTKERLLHNKQLSKYYTLKSQK